MSAIVCRCKNCRDRNPDRCMMYLSPFDDEEARRDFIRRYHEAGSCEYWHECGQCITAGDTCKEIEVGRWEIDDSSPLTMTRVYPTTTSGEVNPYYARARYSMMVRWWQNGERTPQVFLTTRRKATVPGQKKVTDFAVGANRPLLCTSRNGQRERSKGGVRRGVEMQKP
jgi:hypothetical protein